MKAAVVLAAGQTPVYADFAEPQPQEGEHLIHVTASALSHLARMRASGRHYSAQGLYPFAAGVDGVGRLDDGRRVYFVLPRAPFGAMAERSVAPAAHCIALPDSIDDVTAAAIANPGMSSWAALLERAHLKTGETVLVNGATGSSGSLAIRIARHLGAGRVIATGRNAAALEALGADATIPLDGDAETLETRFRPVFERGVDIVLDYLWGPSALAALIAAARASREGVPMRFVQIGSLAGREIALPADVLRASAITLMGSGIGSVPLERLLAAIAGVMNAAQAAGLALAVEPVPLSDVSQAWAGEDSRQRTVFTVP